MKYSTSLKLNHIFRRLYHTSGVADGLLVLYARKNRTDGNRVGVTVSKKLGKAHVRNRTRRRIREELDIPVFDFNSPERGKVPARLGHRGGGKDEGRGGSL